MHSLNKITKVLLATIGGLAEWSIATVLKTVVRESGPGVRIPRPPPLKPDNKNVIGFFIFTPPFIKIYNYLTAKKFRSTYVLQIIIWENKGHSDYKKVICSHIKRWMFMHQKSYLFIQF